MHIYLYIHVSLSLLCGGHVGFVVVLEVEHLMLTWTPLAYLQVNKFAKETGL